MNELLKTILTVLGTIIVAWLAYRGQKYIRKSSDQATKDDRDAAWNADYRSGAERHMYWDVNVVSALRQLQDQVHALEDKLHMDRTDFTEIPDPPPLFPPREPSKPPAK